MLAVRKALGASALGRQVRALSSCARWDDKKFRPLLAKKFGEDVLHEGLYNKGLAFDYEERDRLGLRGLLPPVVKPMEEQLERNLRRLRSFGDDSERKNLYLQDVHSRNETLFHRLLIDNVEEIAPLVYTPTVGAVCQKFGSQYLRARGMYFAPADRGHMSTMVHNWQHRDVHVICVTDGGRILGLGDLGAHGMGIPIGKLALYCAAGGIAPHRVLPVMLDVGTDNEQLRNDPDYIGTRIPRMKGAEYDDMVAEFMHAVTSRWPRAVVQFEDFSSDVALKVLNTYRDRHLCFNDDIQGTGAVTLAGILSAVHSRGGKQAAGGLPDLTQEKVVVAGAGSAGLGVCDAIVDCMVRQGLTVEEARSRFYVCSSQGLLGAEGGAHKNGNIQRGIQPDRQPWVRADMTDGTPMLDVVNAVGPTILLGLSATPGIFNEEVVKSTLKAAEQPIIFPLSNPTSKCEVSATDALRWTDGKAIFASGSPFGAVTLDSGQTITPSQCNNMWVFPGVGLGAALAGCKSISDLQMFRAAGVISKAASAEDRARGQILPHISQVREVSKDVAVAVIEAAMEEGLATQIGEREAEDLFGFVERKMYYPEYVPLVSNPYR